MKIEHFDDMI